MNSLIFLLLIISWWSYSKLISYSVGRDFFGITLTTSLMLRELIALYINASSNVQSVSKISTWMFHGVQCFLPNHSVCSFVYLFIYLITSIYQFHGNQRSTNDVVRRVWYCIWSEGFLCEIFIYQNAICRVVTQFFERFLTNATIVSIVLTDDDCCIVMVSIKAFHSSSLL